MNKLNHAGLRVKATKEERAFIGPAKPNLRGKLFCGKCGTPRATGSDCVPCGRIAKAAYKIRHAEKVRAARSIYRKALHASGAEERASRKAAKAALRVSRRRAARSAWKEKNPGVVNASTAKRFAAKLRATPPWANSFFIEEAYHLAALRSRLLGFKWHVDHVVPLRSKLVCGLHVENNLEVIPARTNMVKNNRYWPQMPGSERRARTRKKTEWVALAA